jgi:hypothetical protein
MVASLCSIRPGAAEIEDHKCIVLEQTVQGSKESFWLDPARDFIILRVLRDYRGNAFEQLDISYSADEICGWIPSAWRGLWKLSRDNGMNMTLQESFEARVISHELNFLFRAEDFELKFPVDTFVEDQRSGEGYIAQKDNAKRMITLEERERNSSYRELVNSESGMAGRSKTWSRNRLFFLALSILGLCIGLMLYYAARKRKGAKLR